MRENETDTNDIIAAILSGEKDRYVELIRRYQDEVRKVVNGMLYDGARTEELMQQIFVRAFQTLESFDREREFLFWIKALARNEVRQHLRAEIRYSNRLTAYREHLLVRYESEQLCEKHDELMGRALAECRQKLAPNGAEVIRMRYEQSLPLDEIADRIDRSVGATQQLLMRIRLQLKKCVKEQMSTA